jgi:hypothetical protein
MPATPTRIAISLNDGVVLSKIDSTIKSSHPNAEDAGGSEIEMFFDNPADAQVLLNERWDWRSVAGRPHEQVELDSSLGLGTVIPVTPAAPQFEITDAVRGIVSADCIVSAYSVDYNTERYAVEVMGTKDTGAPSFLLLDDGGMLLLDDDVDGTSGILLG